MKIDKLLFYASLALVFSLAACNPELDFMGNRELANTVFSEESKSFISESEAINIAQHFINSSKALNTGHMKRAIKTANNDKDIISITNTTGTPLMYVINNSDGGFVIVGANKNYYPILGYSETATFDIDAIVIDFKEWIDITKESIIKSEEAPDSIKEHFNALWKISDKSDITHKRKAAKAFIIEEGEEACWNRCDELFQEYGNQGWNFAPLNNVKEIFAQAGYSTDYDNLCYGAEFNHSTLKASVIGWRIENVEEKVDPLLKTAWHQRSPFNDLCDGHPAGCAAIALSQVMYYYKYPQNMTYNGYQISWDRVKTYPSSEDDNSALVRLVGSICGTVYMFDWSWTTPKNFRNGIKNLGYNVEEKDYDWVNLENYIFGAKRPVILLGSEHNKKILPGAMEYVGESHYWVCDGCSRKTYNRILYFTEWQPHNKGTFIPGWGTMQSPQRNAGSVFTYFHMNWGNGSLNDAWLLQANGKTYEYSRKCYYISKPYNK